MNSALSLIFDFLIFSALSVVIYYCIRLSRQFTAIKEDRAAFENLIKAMNLATSKSDTVLKNMRETLAEESEIINDKVNRARALGEELEIIIQAGDSLANRLEAISSQKAAAVRNKTESHINFDDYDEDAFKTLVEKNLLEAVRSKTK